jgi:hypothetical protein
VGANCLYKITFALVASSVRFRVSHGEGALTVKVYFCIIVSLLDSTFLNCALPTKTKQRPHSNLNY